MISRLKPVMSRQRAMGEGLLLAESRRHIIACCNKKSTFLEAFAAKRNATAWCGHRVGLLAVVGRAELTLVMKKRKRFLGCFCSALLGWRRCRQRLCASGGAGCQACRWISKTLADSAGRLRGCSAGQHLMSTALLLALSANAPDRPRQEQVRSGGGECISVSSGNFTEA